MIHLPIHYRLHELGEEIADQLLSDNAVVAHPATKGQEQGEKKQEATGSTTPASPADTGRIDLALRKLQESTTGSENFKLALSILAPVLTGIFSKYLEHVVT